MGPQSTNWLLNLSAREHPASSRHVKCDEGYPACARCVSAHRQCVRHTTRSRLAAQPNASGPVTPTALELAMSHYFRTKCVPVSADEFNRDFWSRSVLQAAYTLAPVWHAANAVAGLAWSQNLSGSLEGGNAAKLVMESTVQNSRSLSFVLRLSQSASLSAQEKLTVLTCSALFTTYALQTGDWPATMRLNVHVCRLLRSWQFWKSIHSCSAPSLATELMYFFVKGEHIGREAQFESPQEPSDDWYDATAWLQKRPFDSVILAYLEIDMLWTSVRSVLDHLPYQPGQRDISAACARRSVFHEQFTVWESRYETLRSFSSINKVQSAALEARRTLLRVLLRIDLGRRDGAWNELCWDEFEYDFHAALQTIQAALTSEGFAGCDPPRAQFTPALYKALGFIAKICRAPTTRRKAIELLRGFLAGLIRVSADFGRPDGDHRSSLLIEEIMRLEESAWNEKAKLEECEQSLECISGKFIFNNHRVAKVRVDRKAVGPSGFTLFTMGDILSSRSGTKVRMYAYLFG